MKRLPFFLLLSILTGCGTKTVNQATPPPAAKDSTAVVKESYPDPIAGHSPTKPGDTTKVVAQLITKQFPGYELSFVKKGDLDRDGNEDLVAVASQDCTAENGWSMKETVFCRKVVFLLNDGKGNYSVGAYEDNAIECSDCGGAGVGDPYVDLVVKDGEIVFESFYGACDKTRIWTTYNWHARTRKWRMTRILTNDYNCNNIDTEKGVEVVEETQTPKDFGVVVFGD